MSLSINHPREKKYQPDELLQMYRRRSGLTQAQLAELIGLQSKRMVQSWETGEAIPKSERLQRLIEVYLERKVFLPEQELKEALKLWNCIKDFFDATNNGILTYPIFDQSWFETHLYKNQITSAPARLKFIPRPQTPDQVPNNLPVHSNRLFGREKNLAEIARLLQPADTRLVTLYGPGGTGKTRLALQIAHQLSYEPYFADGIYWVDLSTIHDSALVISSIAQVLALKETSGSSLLDNVKSYLERRRILLVLDNFEQVVQAASYLADLLASTKHLKLIVTSRTILRIYAEQIYPVVPLELPTFHPGSTFEQLQSSPSIQLFIAQAQRVEPRFHLTLENGPVIAEICVKLDGLPLALELAAARIKLFTPQALLKRLHNRFELLTGGSGDRPERHQTLQAALNWSYELLSPTEKALFRRIAVFTGGMTLKAVEQICLSIDVEE
jgi:transcriptional regulator with XRE-family HTH domain